MIMGSEPDWAYLPVPVLCLILEMLLEPIDHIWFGGVCKQWQSVSKDYKAKLQPCRKVLPMLMFFHRVTETKIATKGSFYSVSQRQIYNVELPVSESQSFCGSSHGWLISHSRKDLTVTLFNPFKSSIPPINLPPIKKNHSLDFVSKVILSADPISAADDYVVLAIFRFASQLIYFKPGFKSWRQVDVQIAGNLTDIIFYKGLAYALCRGMIICFDVNNVSVIVKIVAPRMDLLYCDREYLVESSTGNYLFYVQRNSDSTCRFKKYEPFKVYKLRLDSQSGEVVERVETKSLDGDTVFVGDEDNYSMSLSAANFPGLQQNSIYFTGLFGDRPYGPHDVGFYNIENGWLEHSLEKHDNLRTYILPTFWIVPPF